MSYSKRAVTYSFVVFLGLFTTPQLETPRLFKPAQSYSGGGAGGAVELSAGDVNGDAKVDLVVADSCLSVADCSVGGVGILLGNGDGTFQNVQTFGSGGYQADSVAVGDVNGDGKLDVLVANQCLRVVSDCTQGVVGVLLGNGDGIFQVAQSYYSGGYYASAIAVADVNGDGKLDILVVNSCLSTTDCTKGEVGVLLGNGDGTFQAAQSFSTTGSSSFSVAAEDVNGDGKPDAIVSNYCGINDPGCNSPSVTVFLGSGDGSFTAYQTYKPGGLYTQSVAVADVNGDGRPDLLVDNFTPIGNGDADIGVLLGNAHFATTTSLTSNPNPSIYGQPVTLIAKVSSVGPRIPTGGITFKLGSQPLGWARISGGVATLKTTKLPRGRHTITATYGGDSASAKSVSAELIQVVKQASGR